MKRRERSLFSSNICMSSFPTCFLITVSKPFHRKHDATVESPVRPSNNSCSEAGLKWGTSNTPIVNLTAIWRAKWNEKPSLWCPQGYAEGTSEAFRTVSEEVFSEVAPALVTPHTGHVVQRGGAYHPQSLYRRRGSTAYGDPSRSPPLPHRRAGRGSPRPPPTHRRDALALQGARRRSVAGRAVGDDSGTRPLLGDRLRLAQGRGEAERPTAVHDRDRRARHPLHPSQVTARERVAADHDARLARLGHRAARGRRPADRPDRSRRHPRGRIPPGAAVLAWLRLLRRAHRARLGCRSRRGSVGGADEPPRLHPLRRPGRRRGRRSQRRDGPPGARG